MLSLSWATWEPWHNASLGASWPFQLCLKGKRGRKISLNEEKNYVSLPEVAIREHHSSASLKSTNNNTLSMNSVFRNVLADSCSCRDDFLAVVEAAVD